MSEHIGVMLVENTEVVMHVYRTEPHDIPELVTSERCAYQAIEQKKFGREIVILQIIADFLDKGTCFHIADWKICSRNNTSTLIQEITTATELVIESLTRRREQELILKGMGIELVS